MRKLILTILIGVSFGIVSCGKDDNNDNDKRYRAAFSQQHNCTFSYRYQCNMCRITIDRNTDAIGCFYTIEQFRR